MSSPHPDRDRGRQVRLVEPAYVTMTAGEETTALAALGRLLAWAAAQPAPHSEGRYRHSQRSTASMMHPPPG